MIDLYKNVELNNYSLYLNEFSINVLSGNSVSIKLELNGVAAPEVDVFENLEKFFNDIKILNNVRGSYDPSVKDQFEKLLTVMALTNNMPQQTEDK